MQIQLDPTQMEYLRRQAEAMERIAAELAKLRKVGMEMLEIQRRLAEEPKPEP